MELFLMEKYCRLLEEQLKIHIANMFSAVSNERFCLEPWWILEGSLSGENQDAFRLLNITMSLFYHYVLGTIKGSCRAKGVQVTVETGSPMVPLFLV